MDTETINPVFMKALVRCYMFQKEAKNKVFHNRRFFRHVLKVFRWQRRIRRQIEANNNGSSDINSPQSSISSSSLHETINFKISPNHTDDSCNQHQMINTNTNTSNYNYNLPTTSPTELAPSGGSNIRMIVNGSTNQDQRVVMKKESFADFDIVRRNLWLMIVRKEIIQAHRRKAALRKQKISKSRTIAYECQTHFREFERLNNKLEQHRT